VTAGRVFLSAWLGLCATTSSTFALLKDRSFAGAQFAIMGFGVAMFGSIAILPLFVQGLLGYPVMDAGFLFMPRGLAAGFSMVMTGSVLMRYVDPA
jgi:DHA2 family multidrug resistance protein